MVGGPLKVPLMPGLTRIIQLLLEAQLQNSLGQVHGNTNILAESTRNSCDDSTVLLHDAGLIHGKSISQEVLASHRMGTPRADPEMLVEGAQRLA